MYSTAIAALMGILLLAQGGCKGSTGPDDFLANIIASNDCGVALDIFFDNALQFSLENQESKAIEEVSQGIHELMAKKKTDGAVVFSDIIDVSQSGDYNWIIESPADVKIANAYGELLTVYADGSVLGDIEDQTSQVIQNVPFGVHKFDAVRKSDNILIKSIEIDIQENKEYIWTISQ
jgi:hypothetical protein